MLADGPDRAKQLGGPGAPDGKAMIDQPPGADDHLAAAGPAGPSADQVREALSAARGNILDVRAAATHAAGHLPGSASLPLEPQLADVAPVRRDAWLAARLPSIFLPPPHEPLLVVADHPDLARAVAAHLGRRGRATVRGLALPRSALERLPADLVGRGRSCRVLWRAPAFLRRWAHLLPPPVAGPVLDLACGSGRAAVWLAQQGYRVTGIDHQPEALALARTLAAASGASVSLLAADLRQRQNLPVGPSSVVLMFRFLDRDLVGRVPAQLRPGGVVVLSTFRDAPGYVGNPRPRHRLGGGEAAVLWARVAPPVILVHEEGFDDDGKPSAGVVCRWPR